MPLVDHKQHDGDDQRIADYQTGLFLNLDAHQKRADTQGDSKKGRGKQCVHQRLPPFRRRRSTNVAAPVVTPKVTTVEIRQTSTSRTAVERSTST